VVVTVMSVMSVTVESMVTVMVMRA